MKADARPPEFKARTITSLGSIKAAAWNACAFSGEGLDSAAGPLAADPANPFVSHEFLAALETSGCVGPSTGWDPVHVIIETADGTLAACAPCYLKSHSQGEYVFDHSWADAYQRAGGSYYPKLQVAAPFSPVTGPRLLVRGGETAARQALIGALKELRRQSQVSSLHVTFADADDASALAESGFLRRCDQQFHWLNEGYSNFDNFLAALASRKRKAIKRERRDALGSGITIETLTGRDITEAHWHAFFGFYMDTGSRKWGRPYLTRTFFTEIGAKMAERIVLIMARREGRYIAGAINLLGRHTLYGRNWGCIEDHPFLHFEVCYYQAIEFAITRKLRRVEAGAQGEHKLARGYQPVMTHSAHDFSDPGFRRAVADFLKREGGYVAAAKQELVQHLPFRQPSALAAPGDPSQID